MSNCIKCDKNSECDIILDNGETICNNCSYENCSKCFKGECEVELENGEYVCTDCYSDLCDRAYEDYKDRLSEF